ncbi:MAG: integrating conjugative element protein [Burkholderiales bacterium PBB4]|nr:MAG: integrating conjugative element protein [Burkholderiales bacterium PBB4]
MATTSTKATGGKVSGKAPAPFPISAQSPFPDKYDIEAERNALKDLVDTDDFDQVTLDPRYSRYLELERREELLRSMQNAFQKRGGANAEVEVAEASKINFSLGALTDEEEDEMQLHTRDASRLFMGRAVEPGKSGYSQSGAKKVGAALRTIWYLSGNNNPYADFALIEAGSRITAQVQELENLISDMESRLEKLKVRGLSFSVLKADPPVRVALGFRSPYGYSLAHLVSTFDYYARVVKTMVRKDMKSDQEGYADLYGQTRRCRSIFERVIWFQRYLMREELREMTRSDWLPTADQQAKKRVQAAVALFGELPREVFNGQIVPRHSRRQLDVSVEELRLLSEVPLAGADPELESATAALV